MVGEVTSVNGKTGDVVLSAVDVSAASNTGEGLSEAFGDGLVQLYNLCDFSKLTKNVYLGANGAEVSTANYGYSDYIPVSVGATYCWYGAYSISYQATTYDSNKNFIRSIFINDLGGSFHSYTYIIPSDTAFIRFNMGTTQTNTMVIQGTTYPSTYTPYGQKLLSSNLTTGIYNSLGLNVMNVDSNQNTSLGQLNLSNKNNTMYAVALGYQALQNNTTDGTPDAGLYNVAVGVRALQNNTIGNHNTAVGYQAALALTTGTGDTAVGEDALLSETTGTGNTALGMRAMQISSGAMNNTAVGVSAMYWDTTSNVTGTDNTAIGHYAGSRVSSDTDLTFLGHFSNKDLTANVYSDSTALGANAVVSKSHQVMLGSPNVTVVDTYGDFESLTNGRGLILLSPSGTKYKLAISDAGALTVTAV